MTKEELNKCLDCVNCDIDGSCIAKQEAPFGSFICEHNEQFEPLDTEEIQRYTENRCEALEKENAELKELLDCDNCCELEESECETCAEFGHFRCKGKAQLTKAKDLIKNIIRVTWGEGWNYSLDWKVKAEAFLKEVRR